MKSVFICVSTSVAITVMYVRLAYAVDLYSVASQAATSAASIRTVEFYIEGHQGYRIRYVHDGPRMRVDYFDRKAGARVDHMAIVSDGLTESRNIGKLLITGSKPTSSGLPTTDNPLIVMYLWLLSPGGDFTWPTVCNVDAWKEAFDKADGINEVDFDGARCYKVAIELPKARAEILFDADRGCVPIQWKSINRQTGVETSSAVVLRSKVVDTPAGPVLFPLETRYSQSGGKNVLARTTTAAVDVSTLKINEPVDLGQFELIPTHTTHVIRDDGLAPQESSNPSTLAPPARFRVWLVAANAIAILILGMLLLRTFLRRRHAAG